VYKSKDSERRIREMDQELREKKDLFAFFLGSRIEERLTTYSLIDEGVNFGYCLRKEKRMIVTLFLYLLCLSYNSQHLINKLIYNN
jgi:hypothetical protein